LDLITLQRYMPIYLKTWKFNVIEERIYFDLSKNINDRLCSIELVKIFRETEHGYDPFKIEHIILPLNNNNLFVFLRKIGYPDTHFQGALCKGAQACHEKKYRIFWGSSLDCWPAL